MPKLASESNFSSTSLFAQSEGYLQRQSFRNGNHRKLPNLDGSLLLNRCPHCGVANPNLFAIHKQETVNNAGIKKRYWVIYQCKTCGGLVSACASMLGGAISGHFPEDQTVSDDIPDRPREYLVQAIASIHTPAGAVLLAASSVDSMLKEKGYVDGSLYSRIQNAIENNLLTTEMAKWAHEIRLDANDQRHADDEADLPDQNDATKAVDFASALAEYLFVLPARIERGRLPN